MNANIAKLALDAGLINYVDLETPRRYFVHGNADTEEVEDFALLIATETLKVLGEAGHLKSSLLCLGTIVEHFGAEYGK